MTQVLTNLPTRPAMPPMTLTVHGYDDGAAQRILLLHEDCLIAPDTGITQAYEFADNGHGGFIAPARATNGCWGYLNERGEWLIEPTLEEARTFSEDGIARFRQGERWGFVDLSGKIIIEPQYEDCFAFGCGLAPVWVAEKKWRYINRQGELAFDATFRIAHSFSTIGLSLAATSKSEGLGFIDTHGQWAIKPQFKQAESFGTEGVTSASVDGDTYGLIDRNGLWLLKPTHERIQAFNIDGLAYFRKQNSWDNGNGYLNAKGEAVIDGERHLSENMACGVASNHYNGSNYLTKHGKPLTEQHFRYGSHFNQHGFAMVRTNTWQLLRDDGSLATLPAETLEPLTNRDRWLIYAGEQTPFAPFLCKDGSVIYVDRDGHIAYRIQYEQAAEHTQASIYDAGGQQLWRSAPSDDLRAPQPFFETTIDAHLDQLDAAANVLSFADSVIAHTEDKLHRYAQGETIEGERDTDDDDSDEDEVDDIDAHRVTTLKRLIRGYVGEAHNGHFDFLSGSYSRLIDQSARDFRDALVTRFGDHDPDPEAWALQAIHTTAIDTWPIKLKQPITAATASAPTLDEASELWLGIYQISETGDGDIWHEIWMICAPSIDAMQLALRTRKAAIQTQSNDNNAEDDTEDTADETASDLMERPQTYGQWLAAVREDKYAISEAPASIVDEALVDAAIDADVGALEYAPAAFQTEARLAALIRKDASTASNVPAKCMTSAGLALARSLYENDTDWSWRDERNSNKPKTWEKNSLYDVWGALLTEDECIKAMKGGEGYDCVPLWLRTARVEKVALDSDLYNISYIDPKKITPELAARAVRHDYGGLIEHIPHELMTPELCLISAKASGLSLEHIPKEFRTVEVCVAAVDDDPRCFVCVPSEVNIAVCTTLIEATRKDDELDANAGTHWHRYRAWTQLWHENYDTAIADSNLAVSEYGYHIACLHYIRASAYHALGRNDEAATEAANVLALVDINDFKPEFNSEEDTSWLKALAEQAKNKLSEKDDATLSEHLRSHPLALENIPRERISREMIDIAVTANQNAVRFVPKRLMTAALYVLAVREQHKRFSNIPAAMLSEEACMDVVANNGYALRHILVEWRTAKICAAALHNSAGAMEYVPESIRSDAQKIERDLPREDDDDDDDDDASGKRSASSNWITSKMVDQLSGETTTMKRAKFTGLAMLLGMGAKSDAPTTLPWPLSWLEQRPFAAMMINASLALFALICHTVVTITAFRLEGVWVGLATAILMGFAELYWVWRHFTSDPMNIAIGANAIIVLLYVFGYRWVHKKVSITIASKRSDS